MAKEEEIRKMHQEKSKLIDNIEQSKKRMLDMDEEQLKINKNKLEMEEEKVKLDETFKSLKD